MLIVVLTRAPNCIRASSRSEETSARPIQAGESFHRPGALPGSTRASGIVPPGSGGSFVARRCGPFGGLHWVVVDGIRRLVCVFFRAFPPPGQDARRSRRCGRLDWIREGRFLFVGLSIFCVGLFFGLRTAWSPGRRTKSCRSGRPHSAPLRRSAIAHPCPWGARRSPDRSREHRAMGSSAFAASSREAACSLLGISRS